MNIVIPPPTLERPVGHAAPLVDPFARPITYLRVSVTDRCDLRCVYCMAEHMTFLPKAELLTLEELDRLCSAFVAKGVRKLRLTGGEPLVRRGIMTLFSSLSRHLGTGALDELTLTTNGSQLTKYATELAGYGVKRINVSLDTLDPEKFRAITRWGDLKQVIAGIDAAQTAGLKVKINAVALKGVNEALWEIEDRIRAEEVKEQGFVLAVFSVADLGWNNGPNESTGLPPSTYDEMRRDTANETIRLIKDRLANAAPDRRDRLAADGHPAVADDLARGHDVAEDGAVKGLGHAKLQYSLPGALAVPRARA